MPKATRDGGIGRRGFLTVIGASAGAAVIAKASGASAQHALAWTSAGAPTAPGAPAPPGVPAMFGPLHPGARVERWAVVQVHPVKLGAVPVVLAGADGVPFQVDVLRREPSSAAVGRSRSLAVYVVNGGGGAQPTHEDHGLAAMALAGYLADRERAGAPVPRLLTHGQRTMRHPHGIFSVF